MRKRYRAACIRRAYGTLVRVTLTRPRRAAQAVGALGLPSRRRHVPTSPSCETVTSAPPSPACSAALLRPRAPSPRAGLLILLAPRPRPPTPSRPCPPTPPPQWGSTRGMARAGARPVWRRGAGGAVDLLEIIRRGSTLALPSSKFFGMSSALTSS